MSSIDAAAVHDAFPTGSRVRIRRAASMCGAPATGTIIGCYAYEDPVYVVKLADGSVETLAASRLMILVAPGARRRDLLAVAPAA